MILQRELDIISILMNQYSGIKGRQIADILGVSDRTIRKDISHINEVLNEFGAEIKSNKKDGYYIDLNQRKIFNSYIKQHENIGIENRIYAYLGDILFNQEISIFDLSEKYYYSEETIISDLQKLEQICMIDYSIQLFHIKQNTIYCHQSEINIRKFFFKLAKEEILKANTKIPQNLVLTVNGNFNKEEFEELENKLKQYCRDRYIKFSGDSLYILSWTIYFSILRNEHRHKLEVGTLKVQDNYFISKLKDELEKDYLFYDEDQIFINEHARTLGMIISNQNLYVISDECSLIVQEFSKDILDKYGFQMNQFSDLYLNFQVHIDIMLNRIDKGMPLKNPILNEVKKKYLYAYEMATIIVPIIYRRKNVYLSDDELSYVAIYLQNYIENKLDKLTAITVTSAGISIQRLLENWINKEFSSIIKIIDNIPSYELDNYLKYHKIDLVLSTVSVFTNKVSSVNIHEIPNESDRDNISKCIRNIRVEKNMSDTIKKIFNEKMILNYTEERALEDILYDLSTLLYENGFISETTNFFQKLVEREYIYPTKINELFMTPHPLEEIAIKNGVAIGILKKGIKNDPKLRIIMVLALNSMDSENVDVIFQVMQTMAMDHSCLMNLINCSKTEFSQKLIEEERRKI